MRRAFRLSVPMLLILLLLPLSACEDSQEDTLSKLESFYSSLSAFTARVSAKVELSDCVQEYVLDWEYDRGAYRITVAEPEILEGIYIAGSEREGLTLGYDDAVLTVDPSGEVISPLDALTELLFDWKGGVPQDYCYELCGEENTLAVSYSRVLESRRFSQRVWFSTEDFTPVRAEVFSEGEMVAAFDFLLFTIS